MRVEPPADPWASPLEGVEKRNAGQGAVSMATQKLRGAASAGFLDGLGEVLVAKDWAKGAIGEGRVGRSLEKLPFGWTVLHDLTIPGSVANVDHLVIGPAGLFTVNTKNHSGQKVWVGEHAILLNGHKTDYLRKIRWEAREVQKLLDGPKGLHVTPVLAIFCKELTVKQQPNDVTVLDARWLRRWLAKQPLVLGQAALDPVQRSAGAWARGANVGVRQPRTATRLDRRNR